MSKETAGPRRAVGPVRRSGLGAFGVWVRDIVIVVVCALLVSTLSRMFVVQMFSVPTGSMETTLDVGDRFAVQKVARPQRGDIIVFRDTMHWLPNPLIDTSPMHEALAFVGFAPDESTGYLVKRLIGLPGDHVTCCDVQGRVSVNGVALDETGYLYTDPGTGQQNVPSTYRFDLVVPAGTVFVMGDHRGASADSRCHLGQATTGAPGSLAFIPQSNIVGTAIGIVYPFSRFRGFSRPATYADVPAPSQPPPAEPVITNGAQITCG